MINQLERYFDQMARVIRKIEDMEVYREKDFSSLLEDKNHQSYLDLISFLPKLISDARVPRMVFLRDLNDEFFAGVSQVIQSGNNSVLHLLLYYMDRGIKECYMQSVGFEDDAEMCDALNSNQAETHLIILRKAECKWGKRELGSGLQGVLKNFFYIDQNKLNGMLIKNYILDPKAVFDRSKKVLKLAISPVTARKTVEFSAPYERVNESTGAVQKLFRVENICDEEWITSQVFENIMIAGDNGADILVFPSIWERTDKDQNNTNRSSVILNGGEILFEQHKRCDYKYDTKDGSVYEDINRNYSQNNVLHMMHIEGLGRICVIICYDYLDEENRERIMRNARPTLVCTPSFSTGSFHFETLSGAFFKQNCNWIWCNTCSALHETNKKSNFEIIGMITTLSKRCEPMEMESFQQIFEGKARCGRENCTNCLYYAEIPLTA